jgi:D-3-phosphoglycerate dehydrogenase
MKLLVTTYVSPSYQETLESMFESVSYEGMMKKGRVLTEDEFIEVIRGMDVVVVEFDPLTRRVLEAADNLKVIASVRGGAHANVDIAAATERNIPVLFCPGRNGDTVADFTLGLMIAVSRGLALGHQLIKTRVITDEKTHDQNGFCKADVNWVGQTPEKFAYLQFKGPTLAGKRLGLIGYGAIGREVVKRALAFDMDVIAYDPFVSQDRVTQAVTMTSLDEVMSTSDFVSIHIPVNAETRGLITAEKLGLMRPDAYLINTARAAVLDYEALVEMLQEKKLAGAALDVYPIEPLPDNHPLLDLDNAVLTPHIGGCSLDPYDRSYRMLIGDLRRFFAGKRPERVYNPAVYATE